MKRLHPSNVLDLLHSTNSMSVTNGAIRTFFLYGALAKMVNGLCDAPFTTDRVSPECKRDYQLFYDIQCGESETKNVPWANKSKYFRKTVIPHPAVTLLIRYSKTHLISLSHQYQS